MTTKVMNGLDLQSQRIQSVGSPSSATDAANKSYVDNVAAGLQWKAPVRAASTGNITLTAPGATIDGVSMASNDRFLAKDQTTSQDKGIYVWNGAASAATRATDADTGTELAPGTAVTVTEGTANADKTFLIVSDAAITIGTTAQTWGQFAGGGTTYSAGNGLNLTSTTFNVVPGSGILADGTSTRVDPSVVVRKYAANVPAQASPSFTHNLGTMDVQVTVFDQVSGTKAEVLVDKVHVDTNTVQLLFASAPTASDYRVVIFG